jgi:hypothetical protein|tara:strand:+ start:1132 stop:1314 length:183 start_codon:yes stop_codon:yes gene_type:complete
MKVFKSKRDGKLYIMSHNRPPKYTGSWYEVAEFQYARGRIGPWKQIPRSRRNDYVLEREI